MEDDLKKTMKPNAIQNKSSVFGLMEDDLNSFEMKGDRNFCENGRRPYKKKQTMAIKNKYFV